LKFAVLYLSLSRGTGRRFLVARLPQAKRCVSFSFWTEYRKQ